MVKASFNFNPIFFFDKILSFSPYKICEITSEFIKAFDLIFAIGELKKLFFTQFKLTPHGP